MCTVYVCVQYKYVYINVLSVIYVVNIRIHVYMCKVCACTYTQCVMYGMCMYIRMYIQHVM